MKIKHFILLIIFLKINCELPKLLIKIPTRSRPAQFFKNLDRYYQFMSFEFPYQFLISCDIDDESMNNENVIKRLQNYPNLTYCFGQQISKVEAYNRNINEYDFDILIVSSDDMKPIMKNFDKVIVKTMQESFPDYDGVLNFNDGFLARQCNTLPIIGKKFYKRFNYIFNPTYKSFEANIELASISKILKKEKVSDEIIMTHMHPAWGKGKWDDLYNRNQQFASEDKYIFQKRRENNFYLSKQEIENVCTKKLSILICTLENRANIFQKLYSKLQYQIHCANLENEIEILYFKDNYEYSVGYKRNVLLEQSNGKYVCFLDDDDEIHDKYIKMIYEKLSEDCDCISLSGLISFNGHNNTKKFIHSIKNESYFEQDNIYYRPPNHLNPIKRYIAIQFHFPEKNYGEDFDWAMQIANSKLLKTEAVINEPYYFYLYKDK